jgi:transcriptional regulator with XRE-family HTH domain
MKTIVKELEKYRLENRISQQKLAQELDVAFCTVNRWFKDRNVPNQIQEYHIKKILRLKRRKKNDTERRSSH